jgi:hypothetical protein
VPELPKMVKDYVDLLVGSVVDDDSRVEHLLVLLDSTTHDGVDVTVRCLPLSIFEAEFDRAFRTLDHGAVISTVTPDRRTEADAPFLNAAPNPSWRWGLSRFGREDQDALGRHEGLLMRDRTVAFEHQPRAAVKQLGRVLPRARHQRIVDFLQDRSFRPRGLRQTQPGSHCRPI